MPLTQGLTQPIPNSSIADGSNPVQLFGKAGDAVVSELHGKYYTAAYRGKLFSANVSAVTVPQVASNLVSVFTLWNPPGSGVVMEIVETTVGQVLATTVVDTVGWYFSTAVLSAAGTFTTAGTVQNKLVGGFAGAGKFYSAYTHSGTPVLIDIIGDFGAVTATATQGPTKLHDGKLILPPGIAMSVAMSTAAGTASGLAIQADWAEFPI